MRIADAHCHFFSSTFFETLGRQGGNPAPQATTVAAAAGVDAPGTSEDLADRWAAELDRHDVARAALIASVPDDESSVATAVARYPHRFVGFFVIDPTRADTVVAVDRALELGLRTACLFPAMHRYALSDERLWAIADCLAARPGTALFAHCGAFSVGIRRRLGLPSPFESRYGNPLDLQRLAERHPHLPIIVPHFGAGMLREALMLADLCSNVHLDTSSSNGWIRYFPNLSLTDVFAQALAVVGPRRLLFGTDSSFFPRGWLAPIYAAQRQILVDLSCSDEETAAVLGGNFERLFPVG